MKHWMDISGLRRGISSWIYFGLAPIPHNGSGSQSQFRFANIETRVSHGEISQKLIIYDVNLSNHCAVDIVHHQFKSNNYLLEIFYKFHNACPKNG
jgi:hypothetical protein